MSSKLSGAAGVWAPRELRRDTIRCPVPPLLKGQVAAVPVHRVEGEKYPLQQDIVKTEVYDDELWRILGIRRRSA